MMNTINQTLTLFTVAMLMNVFRTFTQLFLQSRNPTRIVMLNPAVANHIRAEAKMVYQIAHARLTQINSTLLFLSFISFRVLRLQRTNLYLSISNRI